MRPFDRSFPVMRPLVDIPPVWLVFAILLAWFQSRLTHWPVSVDTPAVLGIALCLIGAGIVLTGLAAYEFWRHKTTIIPHQNARALITSGIFARTRNPIYLADALILAGFILGLDAVLSLPLVALFIWWIESRFIVAEEDRLRQTFGAEFDRYERKVRRWL